MNCLLVDIGNSRIKWATTNCSDEHFEINYSITINAFIQEIIALNTKIEIAIFSSVHYDKKFIETHFSFIKKIFFLDHETSIPIINQYQTPETLGKDRLCNVIAAQHLFKKKNILVIDCGTCIKLDSIDKNGIYKGGSISPGMNMRYEALHAFTAKLPKLNAKIPDDFIGNNTMNSIHSGVVQGIIHEIEGFIYQYKRHFKNDLTIIITGGDANFLVKHLNNEIFAQNNLVLLALLIILKYNVKK